MTIYSQIASNRQKTYLIFALFIALLTGFFYLIGLYYGDGNGYLVLGLVISSFTSFISYFYSDKMVLMSVGAQPANKRDHFDLYTATENMALAAGLPMPKVYVINDPAPNAFATGRNPKHAVVCATTGLLSMMDRAELEGVVAHEISHIKNYDILIMTITSVLVGTISLVADWILRSLWWGGRRSSEDRDSGRNPITLILLLLALIIAPLTATLIQLAVSRKREYLADASAALLTRRPVALASALEKISGYAAPMRSANTATAHMFISNPLRKHTKGDWFANLFSTHPPVAERIRILRSI